MVNLPEEIWISIAELYGLDAAEIRQLSSAIPQTPNTSDLHTRLAWIAQRTEGLYKYGHQFILHLLAQQHPRPLIQSALNLLSDDQKQALVSTLGMPDNLRERQSNDTVISEAENRRLEYLNVLINDCRFPVRYLEKPLRVRHIYGKPVDRLLTIAGDRMPVQLKEDILSMTHERCYQLAIDSLATSLSRYTTLHLLSRFKIAIYLYSNVRPYIVNRDWLGWSKLPPPTGPDHPLRQLECALEAAIGSCSSELMHDLFSLGVMPDSIDPSFWSWDVMRMLVINGVKVSHHMMEDFSVKDDTDNFRSLGLLDFAVYLQEKCRRLDVGGVRKLVANGGLSMIHGVAVFEIISSVDQRTPVTRLVKRARAREIIQLLSDNFDQCIKDL